MGKKRYNSLQKRRRCNSSMEDLPEDVLIEIISLLEVRDAVRTSILSRRWRHLWKYISRLSLNNIIPLALIFRFSELDTKKLDDEEKTIMKKFTHNIDYILASHRGTGVKYMKIEFPFARKREYATLDRWVSFASTSRVNDFSFSLFGPDRVVYGYYFPCHLFSSESGGPHLQTLDLYNCSLRVDHNFDGLKNLTKLCLCEVRVTKGVMQNLLSKCLSLKVLKIIWCPQLDVIEIPSSLCKLKKLNIHTCRNEKVESHSPSLSKLTYNTIGRNPLVFKNALFLQEAKVEMERRSWRHAFLQLPHDFPYLKTLYLTMNWKAKVSSLPETHTIFAHLKHLVLKRVSTEANICATFILKAAPLLEKIVVDAMEDENARQSKRSRTLHDFPHCHLKIVKMTGFIGSRGQVELLRCLLRNATQLEVMSISIDSELAFQSPRKVEIARAMFDKHLHHQAPDIASLTFTQRI